MQTGHGRDLRTMRLMALPGLTAVAAALLAAGCGHTGAGGGGRRALPMPVRQRVTWGQPPGFAVKTNGLRSAELSWQTPGRAVYGYRIERAESPEGPFAWVADAPGNRQMFIDGRTPDTRLRDSTTYYYRVCTIFDKRGTMSDPTPPAATTTAPLPVPPPSLQAAATGSRAVTVAWPPSPSAGVNRYRVQRAQETGADAYGDVGVSHTTNFVDGGTAASTLRDSTKYRYRVIAVNSADAESEPSVFAGVETLPPPAAPRGLAAVPHEVRCVPLTWQPSPEEDVVRYDIYQARTADGAFTKIGEAQGRLTTQYTDGGGNPGTLEDEGAYFYRIRAVNGVTAESADSETVRVTTRPVPPPVRQVAAESARPREVPLSWEASPDTAVAGYEVWRAGADGSDWTQIVRLANRGETAYRDRGGQKDAGALGLLADGTAYQYKVVAFNTANVRSSASEPVAATTKVIPVPPSGLETSKEIARVIRVTWAPNPEKDVYGYLVEVSRKPDGGFRKMAQVQSAAAAALTAEDTGLDPGTFRYYRVKALDREGIESLWSAVVEGRSKPTPEAPAGLTVQRENNLTRVGWAPPPQTDVVQYKVWSKRLLGWDLLAATERPEYILAPAEAAKALTIAVTAIDKDQLESEKSAPLKVEPIQR